jgi:hypothetical protein
MGDKRLSQSRTVFLATLKILHTAFSPTPSVRALNTSTMDLMGVRIPAMNVFLVGEKNFMHDWQCMIGLCP